MRRVLAALILAIVLAGCGAAPAANRPGNQETAFAQIDEDLAGDAATAAPASAAPGAISQATMGDAWPFTVEAGEVKCTNGNHLVFVANGVTYAVNGAAKSSGNYQDIETIRRPDPTDTRYPMSLQPILDIGLPLCK